VSSDQPLREIHVPTGPPPNDVESSSAAIRSTFASLVIGDVPDDLAFVQGGRGLGVCLRESRKLSPVGQLRDLVVNEIFFLTPNAAVVRFTLKLPGGTFGPMEGRVVRDEVDWLIERATFCALVGRVGVRCPPPPGAA
jgi:hypothetical protein